MSLFFDWIPAKSSGKMKAAKTKPKVKMINALAWVTCTKLEEPIAYQLYQLYGWRTSSPAPRGAGFLPSSLLSATDLFGNVFRLEIRSIGPFTPIFLDTSKLNSVLHIPSSGGLLTLFFPDIPDQLQRTGKTWTSCWAGRLFLILWPEAWWYGDGIGFVLGKGKPKELYSDHVSLFHLISISKSHFVASLDLENFKATSEKPLEFPSPLPNSQENVHDGKQLNTFWWPSNNSKLFLEQVPTEPSSQPISMCLVGVSMSISARSKCTSTGLNCAAGSCDGAKKVHVPTANARSAKQRKGRRT